MILNDMEVRNEVTSVSGDMLGGMSVMEGLVRELFSQHGMTCILGLALSVYAYYVERRKLRDSKYVAACDFNEHMNCSKVLTSEYSKGFGLVRHLLSENHPLNLPNCLCGICFYLLQFCLGQFTYSHSIGMTLFLTSLLSCLGSVYLAYILAFILRDMCVVCISTYIVNIYLLYLNYKKL